MKDETTFRQFLKRKGKKEHVVDGLVEQVQLFEIYLSDQGLAGLKAVGEQELSDYVASLEPQAVKAHMRALALYYQFIEDETLARLASKIRQQRIVKSRQAFKLGEFRGVQADDIRRLEAAGIVTVEDMLAAGSTPASRQALAEQTGVAAAVILELVKLSDLARLPGVKGVRARLFYDAGLDTPGRLAEWEPQALREYLVEWVERTGFDGIAPLPKEVSSSIDRARALPEIVVYD